MEVKKSTTSHQKRSTLMWRLNMLVFIATIAYAVIDSFLGIKVEYYVYLAFIGFAIANGLLIRFRRIEISKVFALLVFNIMIFLVATSEPYSTGMYLHFVTAGTVAMAMYGYEQLKLALVFILLSLTLDMMVFTMDISIIPWRAVDPQQARVFFILNTLITVVVCVYTFMLYSKLNFDAENELKANEKLIIEQNELLLKANSELDRFVYSASHDLRAPLSTLTGLINLSESESDDRLKVDYLNLMKKRIKSMDNFISEIIDYSRNSRLEIKQEEIEVKKLLDEVIEDLKYIEGSDQVHLYWDFPTDIALNSDPVRLRMIFSNLISNAIKYRDTGKDKPYIKIQGSLAGDEATIIIEDNGIGINEDYKPRIFDMFFRAHDKSVGSGLGLYIAKETLHKLFGQIRIESELGKGSRFIVTLPVVVPVPVAT